jgi:hypothetical protein
MIRWLRRARRKMRISSSNVLCISLLWSVESLRAMVIDGARMRAMGNRGSAEMVIGLVERVRGDDEHIPLR